MIEVNSSLLKCNDISICHGEHKITFKENGDIEKDGNLIKNDEELYVNLKLLILGNEKMYYTVQGYINDTRCSKEFTIYALAKEYYDECTWLNKNIVKCHIIE